jgi:hypothetical protein
MFIQAREGDMPGRKKEGPEETGMGEFENPGETQGGLDENSQDPALQGFEAPSEEELGGAMAEAEGAAFDAEVSPDLVALKEALEQQLAGRAGTLAEMASVQDLGTSNVVGVGLGSGDAVTARGELSGNIMPGENALVVFTYEAVPNEELIGEVASVAGTHALSALPVIQVPVGVVDAYSHRMRLRPAPGGISVGHHAITAGTLGCLCTGVAAPRSSRLMILSNNHVLANSNAARIGDCISQPGTFDGGSCPRDQIAVLERFVPINFSGGINYVDCAAGWAWPDRVRRELMYLSGANPIYFRVGAAPVAPVPGMAVGKTGRTTQLRQGRVSAVNVSVNVNFGGGRVGHFRDQIAITGAGGNFSQGGDSGSLIWQWSPARPPVGLLFAGGGGTTFGNRITRVLQALQVRLVT